MFRTCSANVLILMALVSAACDKQSPAPSAPTLVGRHSISLQSMVPATAPVGSAELVVTVTGAGFGRTTWAEWQTNGSGVQLQTTVISTTELQMTIPAALLTAAGRAGVVVHALDPQSDDDVKSNELVFSVYTPQSPAQPLSITSITPSSAPAGSPDLVVTIKGTGFLRGGSGPVWTWAEWEVSDDQITALATTFIDESTLTAVVPAQLLAQRGTALLYVRVGDPMADDPPPRTESLTFTITTK